MFGHDDTNDSAASQDNATNDVQINDDLLTPDEQPSNDATQTGGAVEITPSAPQVVEPTDAGPTDMPSLDDQASPVTDTTEPSIITSQPDPAAEPVVVTPETTTAAVLSSPLLDIKQQALQSLSPLIGHLDQTPEEKFRTTMMLIQASDNQELVPTAFEAAQAITDEKTRAQALLDIVNEINYFTQKAS